jgi:hypothetical protein
MSLMSWARADAQKFESLHRYHCIRIHLLFDMEILSFRAHSGFAQFFRTSG